MMENLDLCYKYVEGDENFQQMIDQMLKIFVLHYNAIRKVKKKQSIIIGIFHFQFLSRYTGYPYAPVYKNNITIHIL